MECTNDLYNLILLNLFANYAVWYSKQFASIDNRWNVAQIMLNWFQMGSTVKSRAFSISFEYQTDILFLFSNGFCGYVSIVKSPAKLQCILQSHIIGNLKWFFTSFV